MNVGKPLGPNLNVARELTTAKYRAAAIPISTLAPSRCWTGRSGNASLRGPC